MDYKSATDNEPAIKLLNEWLSYPVNEETPETAKFRARITGAADAELDRLEREVLKAVKVAWIDGLILSTSLNDAVKALVELEAKEK